MLWQRLLEIFYKGIILEREMRLMKKVMKRLVYTLIDKLPLRGIEILAPLLEHILDRYYIEKRYIILLLKNSK